MKNVTLAIDEALLEKARGFGDASQDDAERDGTLAA